MYLCSRQRDRVFSSLFHVSTYVEIVGRACGDGTVEEYKHSCFGETFST